MSGLLFLKQCLIEKKKRLITKWPLTGGGRLREVVARREPVDCDATVGLQALSPAYSSPMMKGQERIMERSN